jgi:hypothetical protein
MWIFTTDGFFSVSQHSKKPNSVMIKARNRAHLERFAGWVKAGWGHELQLEESLDYDYVVRVGCLKTIWAQYLERRTMEMDYTKNVKGHIMEATDPELGHAMLDIWERMVAYQVEIHPGSAQDVA